MVKKKKNPSAHELGLPYLATSSPSSSAITVKSQISHPSLNRITLLDIRLCVWVLTSPAGRWGLAEAAG